MTSWIELILSTADPIFLMVTTCEAAEVPTRVGANVIEVTESWTAGSVPLPVKVTACGEPVALSVNFKAAVNAPVETGLNPTVTVQVVCAARLVPQVFEGMLKELAFVPEIAIELRLRAALPVFLMVTVWEVAEVPTRVPAKFSEVLKRSAIGASPVPFN